MMPCKKLRALIFFGCAILFLLLSGIVLVTMSAHAATQGGFPGISFETYQTSDGTVTGLACSGQSGDECPPIPVGARLTIAVTVGIDNCDPVSLSFGDKTGSQTNYGGRFAENWYHTYNTSRTYTLTAAYNSCNGGVDSTQATITIGGGSLLPPDVLPSVASLASPVATVVGAIFGVASVGLAIAPRATPRAGGHKAAHRGKPTTLWPEKK